MRVFVKLLYTNSESQTETLPKEKLAKQKKLLIQAKKGLRMQNLALSLANQTDNYTSSKD